MLKRAVITIVAAGLLTAAAAAQQVQSPGQKPVEGAATNPQAQPRPPAPPAQLVNVRVDLTITDQRGDTPATPKTVTMLVADRENGRIRTGRGNISLNVDVRPELVRDGRIKLTMGLEYTPVAAESDRTAPMAITESLTLLVDDGKSVVVSQSADPGSDRKVKVELKGTVVKQM